MRNRTAIEATRRSRAAAAARGRDEHIRAMLVVACTALAAGCIYGAAALS